MSNGGLSLNVREENIEKSKIRVGKNELFDPIRVFS